MVLWLSPQPAKPDFYHRRANVSRVLQLRSAVRLFTGKHVYQTPLTPFDGRLVAGFKSGVTYGKYRKASTDDGSGLGSGTVNRPFHRLAPTPQHRLELESGMLKPNTAHALKLEIVTPDATVCSEHVDMVTLPGVEGQMGVYPQHVRLMTQPEELA